MKFVKLRFLETRLVKDGTGTTFTAGEVYELPQASAEHWLSRGVAETAAPASKAVKPRIETATVAAPETTRSENVPLPHPPAKPASPLTKEDIRALPL